MSLATSLGKASSTDQFRHSMPRLSNSIDPSTRRSTELAIHRPTHRLADPPMCPPWYRHLRLPARIAPSGWARSMGASHHPFATKQHRDHAASANQRRRADLHFERASKFDRVPTVDDRVERTCCNQASCCVCVDQGSSCLGAPSLGDLAHLIHHVLEYSRPGWSSSKIMPAFGVYSLDLA